MSRQARPDPNVLAWHARHADADVFISVLVVSEIRPRHHIPRPRSAGDGRHLRRVGRLAIAQPPPAIDGLMAATARVHRLTLVTRNVADVARTGVRVVNPFEPTGS